tara:strand:- start:139 stop:657 length:519 start_codon:yes stop_codon:yes gene_type:complete
MKKKLLIIILFLFLSLNETVNAQNNIYFIDLNFILNNSSAGKKINDQIQSARKKLNSEFNNFKKTVEEKKTKLVNQKTILAREEYEKKVLSLENEITKFNLDISKKQDELLNIQKKSRIQFTEEIKVILKEYAEKNTIDLLVKKENILIGKSELDITKDIFKIFDNKIKKFN